MTRTALLLLALVSVACAGCPQPEPPGVACRRPGQKKTDQFLQKNRAKYARVIKKVESYLDTFDINPMALRRQGTKGKKKLVELLDAYVALHRYAKGKRKALMLERFRRASAVTQKTEYHDMGTVGNRQFKQDATSYMRACYLMDRMGLSIKAYKAQILKVKARLDAHMKVRGPHQRMAFKYYYQHFGMSLPAKLREPFADTITAGRKNPYLFNLNQTYDLTHEVFVPFDYGGKLSSTFFSKADRAYLRRALEVTTIINLAARRVDIVGELLACMRFLGDTDLTTYRDGLAFLLASQRPNGSFGDYERYRSRRGDRLELDLYLHTTSVAMDILPLAFEGPGTGTGGK